MARRRFFVDAIRHGSAELTGEDAQHLKRVLRAEVGQHYEISDAHAAYLAEITEARKDRVVFRVLEPVPSPELPLGLTLLLALIKFDRFEWALEKATELGATRVVPVEAARSEKGLFAAAHKRRERWTRIARESAQQSRRLRPVEVAEAVRLVDAFAWPADQRYWLEEAAGAPPLVRVLPAERARSAEVAVLIGPEGGWTDAERDLALGAGWQPVSLGEQILRAETAAIAAAAVLAQMWAK